MKDQGAIARVNPFRATAVADTALVGHSPNDTEANVAVPTSARALETIREYLRPEMAAPGSGVTIMVSGEHGTGKTHLLVRLLDEARAAIEDPDRVQYVASGGNTFKTLFANVLDALTRERFRQLLNNYYLEAFEAELNGNDLPHADLTQEGRAIKPPKEAVESVVFRQFRKRLDEVTGNTAFTTAFSLVLRESDLAVSIWEWLRGGDVPAVLANRGVNHQIDSEPAAIEALGVVAQLMGGQRRKFVLAIDEISEIFVQAHRRPEILESFRRLLETAKASGSCFILGGLPDLADNIGDAVLERVTCKVFLHGFSVDQVREFVLQSHGLTFGRRRMRPVADEVPGVVWDFTRGNPRQVMLLLHKAFAFSLRGLTEPDPTAEPLADGAPAWVGDIPPITEETIYEAAQALIPDIFPVMLDEIYRIAADRHWGALREDSEPPESGWARFRVEAGDPRGAHVVIAARSVLSEGDIREMRERFESARAGGRPAVLVCVERPSASAWRAIRELLRVEPVVRGRNFERNLTVALRPVTSEAVADQGALVPLTLAVEDIAARVRSLAQVTAPPEAVAREVAARLAPVLGRSPREKESALPPPVRALFVEAEKRLDLLLGFDSAVMAAFDRPGYEATVQFRDRLFRRDARTATGTALVFKVFLEQFRSRVADWFDDYRAGRANQNDLALVCETYQALEDTVSLQDMNGLSSVAGVEGVRTGAETPVQEAVGTLTGFARRVRDAASAVRPGQD